MARSLAERLHAHEQQKARLAEQEAKLKTAERKQRTRQLIEAGGLVDKAGLLDLEPNALYGALLSLRDGASDKDQVGKWTARGGRAFDREARLRDEGKEAIVLTFPTALDREVTTTLRQAGFRFSKVLQHWEGLARFAEAEALAKAHGGIARRVAPADAPQKTGRGRRGMIERATYDLLRLALRIVARLWPLWLFWFVWDRFSDWWLAYLLTFPDRSTASYAFAYRCWPTVALLGPILLMVVAIGAYRLHLAHRTMPIAGIVGVLAATVLTAWPEYRALAPYIGSASLPDILGAIDLSIVQATAVGLLAAVIGVGLLTQRQMGVTFGPRVVRGRSDNFGHADWLAMRDARRLFPGPDDTYGGIVVGEAYRVDQDRVARRAFDPADRTTWGQGGTAPLLVDPCRTGSTHALVFAGPGGFKTTSVGVPTMLTWRGAAVVLDPSREIGPMVQDFRQATLGHRVVTLDPAAPAAGAFNVLDWIDTAAPEAETNVEAAVNWICGEARAQITSGADFFRESGKGLIACLLADMLWDQKLAPAKKTLRHLRRMLVTPEDDMRALLARIHTSSASPLARDLAGTLKGLVAETFSGIYGNASKDTRWLSTSAYADLVSGNSFRTHDLADGRLTVFVQVPLKTLQATPALGRVIVGALLNAAYEADGRVHGRILFLLDEVARLGFMGVLEQARDAGRKYGITLLLLYQSLGQLVGQWGREGKQAWYDATSWRLFAAVQDPDTAKELSAMCGEHGVVATALGNNSGSHGRGSGIASSSSGRSENRSEIRRALIKPDEIIQDTRADEAFVLVRGARPLRCGRAIYFRRRDMAPLVAANRFHPQREAAE